MARVSTYLRNLVLDCLLRDTAFPAFDTIYMSVHDGDPGVTGANEIADSDRVALTDSAFGAASGGVTTNATNLETGALPACSVLHVGFWDAAEAGNFLFGSDAFDAVAITEGNAFLIEAGNISITHE